MTDEPMPDDLGELDERIGFDMLDKALADVTAAERYAAERAAYDKIHGIPDPDSFEPWSEVCPAGQSEEPLKFYGPIDLSALKDD